MVAEHNHLAEQGADLVEIRLDYIRREVNLQRLIHERPCPIIITCRRAQDGGKWQKTDAERLTLLRSAIAAGVDYVDLEDDIAAEIKRFGRTKRIVSLHDFEKTPDDLESLHAKLSSLDADIVKIATMAHHPHDNLRMLRLVRQSEIPTVGICMGEIGTPSRILAVKFGSPFTFATFHQERTLAPGQLSFDQMRNVYRVHEIRDETEIYGVVADPVAQSLSPIVHNSSFVDKGLNKVYVPFRVPAAALDQFLSDCEELGIKGLSVTIPHKEAIMQYCQQVDGAAREIGAVNTVIFGDEGAVGYNTDYRASMNSIDRRLQAGSRRTPLAGHTALVLGAGGAARAIAVGLARRGADVVIAGRTLRRAEKLARAIGCRSVPWEQRHNIKAEVLVNATPVGMHPNVDESPFDMHYLRPNAIVFDTVYNPEQTLLFKEAIQRNCRVISGLEMFIGQAALQFKHFTGLEAPEKLMREQFKRAIGAAKY